MTMLLLIGHPPPSWAGLDGAVTTKAMTHGEGANEHEEAGRQAEHPAVVTMMTPHGRHDGPHMRWTMRRPVNADDAKRADGIVAALREAIRPYKDYRVALQEGFVLLHPERKAKHYHFGNKERRREARRAFDPANPSALLYRKTGEGYELEGAMYTAPREMTEEQLHERIPLSVAQWHAHVNLCLATDGSGARLHRRAGRRGAITTEADCQRVGGRFVPQAGGWMIHVYPFNETPEQIWTH
jgi:hypothetical protein